MPHFLPKDDKGALLYADTYADMPFLSRSSEWDDALIYGVLAQDIGLHSAKLISEHDAEFTDVSVAIVLTVGTNRTCTSAL